MAVHHLKTPISKADVRKLRAGDVVFLSGTMFTARDQAHKRALELHKKGEKLPIEMEGLAVFHCGPIVRKVGEGWQMVAAGPTTSTRMNALQPDFIREFNVRAVIGKGGMDERTAEAMKEHGCVYLAYTGGCAVLASKGVKRISAVQWYDLGMPEAMWVLEVEEFGPLVVSIDARGKSLYRDVQKQVEVNLPKIYEKLR
ncbi:MAG: fumarate hydratase [Hadesarchaea archaeon DG-33-1]|nr:MAG: fumarate hydratase [Hadesarchaea archaeon DG-33-1]